MGLTRCPLKQMLSDELSERSSGFTSVQSSTYHLHLDSINTFVRCVIEGKPLWHAKRHCGKFAVSCEKAGMKRNGYSAYVRSEDGYHRYHRTGNNTSICRARSIQPKFQPVRPGKVVHLKRWTRFFETFPVGPNRSIGFWTEISENFG